MQCIPIDIHIDLIRHSFENKSIAFSHIFFQHDDNKSHYPKKKLDSNIERAKITKKQSKRIECRATCRAILYINQHIFSIRPTGKCAMQQNLIIYMCNTTTEYECLRYAHLPAFSFFGVTSMSMSISKENAC